MPALRDLREYNRRRDFARTSEPKGERRKSGARLSYLIQKHAARALHYDFRLEWNGRLMSWAVPKGPSENPNDKRLAVHVEDHPLGYGKFEGTIPKGEYGGGTVMLWDRGTWEPHDDVDDALKQGKLAFDLHGKRLHGRWALIRLRGRGKDDKDNWLLIKERDEFASDSSKGAVDTELISISSGRSMDEIAHGRKVWHSNKAGGKATAASNGHRQPDRSKKNFRGRLPAFVSPQLATLVDEPPAGDDWLHEIKYDGYRAITSIAGGKVVIRTRNGLDWTDRFCALVPALAELPCDDALLDGEIAVADAEGHTDFGALQDTLSADGSGIGYYIFDLLDLDGEDLRRRPLIERKEKLSALLRGVSAQLLYSDHVGGSGDKVFAHACKIKLEGIVSKRGDAPYVSGRSKSWLKSKCGLEQEFVIIGWRPSKKADRPFSSLLLAVRENGKLRYAGRVGSGYSGPSLAGLSAEFAKLSRKDAPVDSVPAAIARHARFLKPQLVAQIAFRGWTRDALVRQGSFKGLRRDKPPGEIVREHVMPKAEAVKGAKAELRTSAKLKSAKLKSTKLKSVKARPVPSKPDVDADEIAGIHITHPDRVLFAAQGVTKRDLIDYYLSVADVMLPHIVDRPLSLVRCPQGSGKECFFQKHASPGWPNLFKKIRIKEKSGSDDYLYIEDESGLVAAAQMGVLELHIWGSHVDQVERPDRMVFDLDPDEGLAFSKVKDAARELKDRLAKLGLESFPMATGGKGIHVVVPLQRKHNWDDHRTYAEAIARLMAEESPERYVANMSKAKRHGKIFVDYLRNQRGATAIAPYSTRARSGAFVALPISWKTLNGLSDAHPVNVAMAAKKSKLGGDPWPGYHKIRQTLPLSKLRG